jgi:2-dehydropantoate 2-reductase
MGAIGTYIGGSLAAAGYDVSFLERPEASTTIQNPELTIETPDGVKKTNNYKIFFSIKDALKDGQFDVVLLAVKSFDTAGVVESIRHFASEFPVVLCLQNGVENETLLESVLGPGRVIGASIATAVGKRGTGDVFVQKMRGMGVESSHPLSSRVIDALNAAGLKAKGYPRRQDLKWSKMLTNLLGNATSAILDWTPAQIFSDRGIYKLEVAQARETLTVMKNRGYRLVNLPGTPIAPLIWVMTHLPIFMSQPISSMALGKGRGNKMPSFHIDLYHGQSKSEVTYLNGAVVRAAEALGLTAPINKGLTTILEELAAGRIQKSEYAKQPDKLISSIEVMQ